MNMQTLTDALLAIAVTVGIAVGLSIAFVVAGAFFERGKARSRKAVHDAGVPAQHPTQTDDARELVLR
jgi:hypothetical protein